MDYPTIAVVTPGIQNSAYFDHCFLAQQMGAHLVEGVDLCVSDDDVVYVRTIDGLQRVDLIYRRIDDLFLDPDVFFAESLIGVPGLMRAWRNGRVGLVNAPGASVAEDKVVYAFAPRSSATTSARMRPSPTFRRTRACATTTASTCSSTCTSWW